MPTSTKTGVDPSKTASFPDANYNGLDTVGGVLQLAHEVDSTKYKPFTMSMFRLYGVLFVAYLCGCLNGYDGSLMGGLNAMTTYQQYFGM
jgi:hypothetical protein